MELLSPCGNYQALIGCINAGADAVYLAGSKYGARAYADNFTDDQIIEAIKYAHMFNVKVYLTVNTLIKEKEWLDVINYINQFYIAGLDACIVQDIGLISKFNEYFPNMELHVSTQAFSTGVDSVELYRNIGAKRVVLAREVTLNEIKNIKEKCNIEIETFIHGAMCYCYSGQCLFSSCLGGRSGNRGRCAGPCRLEYKGINSSSKETEGYLLSMKDQCTLEILPKLIDAGIDSLKIEGRMKKPEYAAFVTAMYRKYIDMYNKNPSSYKVSNEDIKLLNSFYMRSEIGTGYYFVQNSKDMISINNPAYSKTDESIIKETYEKYLISEKKIHINISVTCVQGSNIQTYAEIPTKNIYVSYEGAVIQESINRPAQQEDIFKQFNKLGESSFIADNIDIYIEGNCFLPVKELNDCRRNLIEKLEKEITSQYNNKNVCTLSKWPLKSRNDYKIKPIVKVLNLQQLNIVDTFDFDGYICISDNLYKESSITTLKHALLIDLPYITRENSREKLLEIIRQTEHFVKGYIVNNWEELKILNDLNGDKFIICGAGLYEWNREAVSFLSKITDSFINSYELNQHEINELGNEGYILTYGKLPLMQTANCIEKTTDKCNKNNGNSLIRIVDRKNYTFPVYRNCNICYNTIFNSVPTSLHEDVLKCKIKENQLISLIDEDEKEIKEILSLFLELNENVKINNFTKGYWKRGVE